MAGTNSGYFPYMGSSESTGTVVGVNDVNCPQQCRLVTGSEVTNQYDHGKSNQLYSVQNIPSYYCVVNSTTPLPPYLQSEKNARAFRVEQIFGDSKQPIGFSANEVFEDEIYNNPRADYMIQVFDTEPTCTNDPYDPRDPLNGHGGGHQKDGCSTQKTLQWFSFK